MIKKLDDWLMFEASETKAFIFILGYIALVIFIGVTIMNLVYPNGINM